MSESIFSIQFRLRSRAGDRLVVGLHRPVQGGFACYALFDTIHLPTISGLDAILKTPSLANPTLRYFATRKPPDDKRLNNAPPCRHDAHATPDRIDRTAAPLALRTRTASSRSSGDSRSGKRQRYTGSSVSRMRSRPKTVPSCEFSLPRAADPMAIASIVTATAARCREQPHRHQKRTRNQRLPRWPCRAGRAVVGCGRFRLLPPAMHWRGCAGPSRRSAFAFLAKSRNMVSLCRVVQIVLGYGACSRTTTFNHRSRGDPAYRSMATFTIANKHRSFAGYPEFLTNAFFSRGFTT